MLIYKYVNKIYQIVKYKYMYKTLPWLIYKIIIRSTTNMYNFQDSVEGGLKKKHLSNNRSGDDGYLYSPLLKKDKIFTEYLYMIFCFFVSYRYLRHI